MGRVNFWTQCYFQIGSYFRLWPSMIYCCRISPHHSGRGKWANLQSTSNVFSFWKREMGPPSTHIATINLLFLDFWTWHHFQTGPYFWLWPSMIYAADFPPSFWKGESNPRQKFFIPEEGNGTYVNPHCNNQPVVFGLLDMMSLSNRALLPIVAINDICCRISPHHSGRRKQSTSNAFSFWKREFIFAILEVGRGKWQWENAIFIVCPKTQTHQKNKILCFPFWLTCIKSNT